MRSHPRIDLVDLQLIFKRSKIDLAEVRHVCERIFAYRKMQSWPPTIVANEKWDERYTAASEGLSVLPAVGEAVDWANALVQRIVHL